MSVISVEFEIDGIVYRADQHGVIHQINPTPIEYDEAYIAQHIDKPDYAIKSQQLNQMRLAQVLAECWPSTLCDFGYGDGSFLKLAATRIPACYGLDLAPTTPPDGVRKINTPQWCDVYTFWDALEHVPDLDRLLSSLPTTRVLIAVPDCEHHDFATWKHRRPNEHLHHFTARSLRQLMEHHGWREVWSGHPEDEVRGQLDGKPNILTAVFASKGGS